MSLPHIYPLGEMALVCEALPPTTLDIQRQVWATAIAAHTWSDVLEVISGINNLTIVFDPLTVDIDVLSARLTAAWFAAKNIPISDREIEIPVKYGGQYGPDLSIVAQHTGFFPEEVAYRHAAGNYVVFFLGFQPGFAYIDGLEKALHTPRRTEMRLKVPTSSVGISGKQTAIHTTTSPSDWQLIGHTPLTLFDPCRNPPTLLQPSDRIRFKIVEINL